MAKQKIKREVDHENGTVTFTVLETGETLVVKSSEMPESIVPHLVAHALNAKVGDAAAGTEPAESLAAMQKVVDNLKEGTWAARSSGDGGGSRPTIFKEALQTISGKTAEEVEAFLAEKSDDEVKQLKQHAQVKAEMEKIKTERAKKKQKDLEKAAKEAAPLEI